MRLRTHAAEGAAGRRIIVAGPPKRGMVLPPSGWFSVFVILASI